MEGDAVADGDVVAVPVAAAAIGVHSGADTIDDDAEAA